MPFRSTRKFEKEYAQAISSYIAKEFRLLPGEGFKSWSRRARRLAATLSLDKASIIATGMVSWTNKQTTEAWRTRANEQGRKLHAAITQVMSGPIGRRAMALINKNSRLINALPANCADTVLREVVRAQQAGARPQTIANLIKERLPDVLESSINRLARTSATTAITELTRARSEAINIPIYVWRAVDDSRTRKSHHKMDGVVVFWKQPPSPELVIGQKSQGRYHAGETYYCRCYTDPVTNVNDLPFPVRVYWHDKIVRMRKMELLKAAKL